MSEGTNGGKWFIVHTYSGYENKVKADIEKTIENRDLQNEIFEVSIPVEKVVEVKNGAKKIVERKMFPSYVLVRMEMNEKTWYIIRNTRGVTGFVGMNSSAPTPLSDEEVLQMGMGAKRPIVVDFTVGDEVIVVNGAWHDTIARISAINHQKQTITIMVEMFGRETPLELGFMDVKKKA